MNVKHLLRLIFFMVLIALVLAKGHKGHHHSKHSNKKDVQEHSDEEVEQHHHHHHHHEKSSDENSSGDDDDDDNDDDDDDNNDDNNDDNDDDNNDDNDDDNNDDNDDGDDDSTGEEVESEEQLKFKDNDDNNEDSDPEQNEDEEGAEAETDNADNGDEVEAVTDEGDDNQEEPTDVGDTENIVNDCDAIKTYLGVEKESAIKECSFNDKGKVNYIYIDDENLTEEDVKKIYTYDSIAKLNIYWNGNQYTIDKAAVLPILEYLSVFNTKGGALNLSALNSLNKLSILEISAPSSKDVYVKSGSFKEFKALKTLYLKQFQFSQVIVDEVGSLENIEEIKCESCGFSTGLNYESFKNLSKLRTLHITSYNKYGKPLNEIPIAFTEITSLKTLILTRQNINIIPEQLSNLTNLEVL
ncbi:hypothetical protein PIROE2DRAFT_3475 [Piromyces sp. E2]|nr:hypothetical protein PIROE2DRAFT_3475 [Piromyces sp. E2]|eukprot:OUM68780.1 hypothetical protein PIROE2DRAFT_3475 [Piromyces sp. E2]